MMMWMEKGMRSRKKSLVKATVEIVMPLNHKVGGMDQRKEAIPPLQ